jgi:hypothetical protein
MRTLIVLSFLIFFTGNAFADNTGSIRFKAGVLMNSGDVKWVAKQDFFLLIRSMNSIKTQLPGVEPIMNPEIPEYCGRSLDLINLKEPEININAEVIKLALRAALKHCKTSFTGECTMTNIPPGEYTLSPVNDVYIGISKINWDYPIRVSAGKETYIELSNDNSYNLWPVESKYREYKRRCEY